MLQIENLTVRIGERVLLNGASANIPTGQRVGLVGPNGTGKTTLLRLVQGEILPDNGSIHIRPRVRIGWVAQDVPSGDQTPLQMVLAADRERTRLLDDAETASDPNRIAEIHTRLSDLQAYAAPARAAAILAGLGFDEAAQRIPLGAYSGGWRMRVALAATLFSEPDLLLLDEPTNHLDLEATLWFERYLASYRHTCIVVSHDRNLLNRAVDHILHLEDQRLKLYRGPYDVFERTYQETFIRHAKLRRRQTVQQQRIQKFIDRFRYKATRARQAQSRIKALERMQPIAAVVEQKTAPFSFPSPKPAAPPLVVFEDTSVGYERDVPVLSDLNLRIDPDDRIALLGANGNGKSTLARLISGRLQLQRGRRIDGRDFSVGYFAQHQLEELDGSDTPLAALGRLMNSSREQDVRARLGTFGFGEHEVGTPIGDLSGGEKARLLLSLASYARPQLLVLDEPTNHLDINARESLVQAINEFEGAVLLITHDRHIVELCADHLWLVANSSVTPFDGTLHDYEQLMLSEASIRNALPAQRGVSKQRGSHQRRDARRTRADRRAATAGYKRAIKDAERVIEELNSEKQRIEVILADAKTYETAEYSPPDLLKRLTDIDRLISEAEGQWISAHDAMGTESGGSC